MDGKQLEPISELKYMWFVINESSINGEARGDMVPHGPHAA